MDGDPGARFRWHNDPMKITGFVGVLRWFVVIKSFRLLCAVAPAGVADWFAECTGLAGRLRGLLGDHGAR